MLTAGNAVSAAHVAFLAGVTDKEINRLVDEEVLPPTLVWREHGRRFAPLTAPLAQFYFQTSDELTRTMRRHVIEHITSRLAQRADFDNFLILSSRALHADFDWSLKTDFCIIGLGKFVESVVQRATQLQQAEEYIVEDRDVLGGTPCFAGTRVPVANVVAASDDGVPFAELQQAYPFLTAPLLEDAKVYVKAHPRPGRPLRLPEAESAQVIVSRKVVRPAPERA